MGSKSVASGWGDILSSITFLIISGYCTLGNIPLIVLFMGASCVIITSFSLIMGSLAFWIEDSHLLSKQIFEFLLTFSNYPRSIYVGTVKFVLLTVIPSGFIGFMPIETIKNFTYEGMFMILGFTLLYLGLAIALFYRGLGRYTSGNKLGFKV